MTPKSPKRATPRKRTPLPPPTIAFTDRKKEECKRACRKKEHNV